MKSFLVIGLGRFGSALAQELCAQGNEVMALDLREDRVQAAADLVTRAAAGDARDPEVLRTLGARNFDCAVVAFSASPPERSFSAASILALSSLKSVRFT